MRSETTFTNPPQSKKCVDGPEAAVGGIIDGPLFPEDLSIRVGMTSRDNQVCSLSR